MNKQEFLEKLGALLACLPAARVAESQAFYAEAIDDRMEEGMSEEEAVAALGSPGAVAEAILDEMPPVPRMVAKTRRRSTVLLWTAIILGSPLWLTLGLAFAMVALGVYLCIWILAATLWLIAAAGVLALPMALVIAFAGLMADNIPFAIAYVGEGLLAAALGVLCFGVALASSRRLAELSRRWMSKALSPFRRERDTVATEAAPVAGAAA